MTCQQLTGNVPISLRPWQSTAAFSAIPSGILTDEQAGERTTASELCLGGLIKHVTRMESATGPVSSCRGPDALSSGADGFSAHMASFRMEEGETPGGSAGALRGGRTTH